jgi:hypothetical protein
VKTLKEETLQRPVGAWEDDIKTNLKEMISSVCM